MAEGISKVALVGNEKIEGKSTGNGISIEGAIFYDPENCATIDVLAEILKKRREKVMGMTFETAKATLLSDPRFFAAMLVHQGRVDGMVAGSSSPTAHVLRAVNFYDRS